jgi:transcriptional regulator with XRE-family HTH domain
MTKEIRELRELAGLSQYRLAAATGIDRTRLSLFENGHAAPSAVELAAIEQVLLEEIGRRSERYQEFLHRPVDQFEPEGER